MKVTSKNSTVDCALESDFTVKDIKKAQKQFNRMLRKMRRGLVMGVIKENIHYFFFGTYE